MNIWYDIAVELTPECHNPRIFGKGYNIAVRFQRAMWTLGHNLAQAGALAGAAKNTEESIAKFVDLHTEKWTRTLNDLRQRIRNGESHLKRWYTSVEDQKDCFAVLSEDIRAGMWADAFWCGLLTKDL